MIRYEELYNLRKQFTDALQKAATEAQNEDEFAVLEDVATDVLGCMPVNLMSCDYIARGTVASYLDEKDRQDTKKINGLMKQIYEDDLFHMNDDYLCDDLQFAVDKFYKYNKEDKDVNA